MTPKEFEVAVITASYCTGETGEDIRPGAALIAQGVNWKNPHRIYKTLKSIVDKGYLEVVQPGGRGRASLYRLSLPDPHRIDTHRSGEGHRISDDQSMGTPSPDRGGHLATYTYSALEGEITTEAEEKVDLQTGEIVSTPSQASSESYEDVWGEPHPMRSPGEFQDHMKRLLRDRKSVV